MSTEPQRPPAPKRRPKTEKHLGRLVSQYAEARGLGVRRVRQRVAAMALLGALERVQEDDSPARFLLKGGIACELRFQDKARATRDLDAIFHGSLDGLLADPRFRDRGIARCRHGSSGRSGTAATLLKELIEDYDLLEEACIEVFDIRGTHSWPPTVTIEPNWPETYSQLADEYDFPVKDIAEAIERVQGLVDRIDNSDSS